LSRYCGAGQKRDFLVRNQKFVIIDIKIEGDFVKKPGVQMVVKIAKALGVSVEDLLK
jgi:hypothetical protein